MKNWYLKLAEYLIRLFLALYDRKNINPTDFFICKLEEIITNGFLYLIEQKIHIYLAYNYCNLTLNKREL